MDPQDNGMSCMVQQSDSLFTLRADTFELDLETWAFTGHGDTAPFSGNVGHCAVGRRSGQPGILIRDGDWLDLATFEWTQLERPPTPSMIGVYTLHTYRGRPTIFGVPTCFDEDGDDEVDGCRAGTEVLQFDPDGNEWTSLGNMQRARLYHVVAGLPRWVCTATTTSTSTTTSSATSGSSTSATSSTTPGNVTAVTFSTATGSTTTASTTPSSTTSTVATASGVTTGGVTSNTTEIPPGGGGDDGAAAAGFAAPLLAAAIVLISIIR